MERFPDASKVYEIAQSFRERCLIEHRSFLWNEEGVWSAENLQQTWTVASPAETMADLIDTLRNQSKEIQMVAVDVLAAGSLFPAVTKPTQERNFGEFLDVLDLPTPESDRWSLLESIFSVEVPGSHTHYKGGKLQNYLSWLFGLRTLLVFDLAQADRDTMVATVRQEVVTQPNESVWDSLIWGMLHTMYPDQLVAVPGDADRKLILRSFSSLLAGKEFPNDFAALDYLRHTLPQPSDGGLFDFYHPDLLQQWGLAKHLKRIEWLRSLGAIDSPSTASDAAADFTIPAKSTTDSLAALLDLTHLGAEAVEEIHDLLLTKRQLIFEGPPGSGKTFVAEKFARWFTGQPLDGAPLDEHVEIVQFHQSYGYEDFVQGIRPETNSDGQLVYRVRDGIFLDMVERAKANPFRRLVCPDHRRDQLRQSLAHLRRATPPAGVPLARPSASPTVAATRRT